NVLVEGGRVYPTGAEPSAYTRTASPGYFRTMGIPILSGRSLAEEDRDGAPLAAVANEAFVRQLVAGRDPIGVRVRWARDSEDAWMTIVGVARETRDLGLAEEDGPALYTTHSQVRAKWKRWSSVVIRTQGDPLKLVASVGAVVRGLDPAL